MKTALLKQLREATMESMCEIHRVHKNSKPTVFYLL